MRLRDDFIPLFGQYKTFYDGFIHNNDNIDRDIAFRHAFINVTIRTIYFVNLMRIILIILRKMYLHRNK